METLASRRLLLLGGALAFMAITLVFVAISLGSRPAEAQERGAFVIKKFGCSAFVPGSGELLFTDEKTHAVVTPSGNTKLTCHFEGPPIAETVVIKDLLCNTFLGLTTESHYVYTKSGKANLTCRVNPGG